jgi:5-methylcytosine-specific restriction endonuclease McrA
MGQHEENVKVANYFNKLLRELGALSETPPKEPERKSVIVAGLAFGRYKVLSVDGNKVMCRIDGKVKQYNLTEIERRYYQRKATLKRKWENEREWDRLSTEVKERDGYKCTVCGATMPEAKQLHAHHIVPKSKGGKDELSNLTTLCILCHAEVHKDSINGEFLKKCAEVI